MPSPSFAAGLYASAAVMLAASAPAWAHGQDAPSPTTRSGQAAAGSPETTDAMGADIVVTAQKKSESLQNVPAAVSVVDNERLAALGVTNLTQVSNLAPGLSITPVRTQAFVFLRGVGQTLTSPNADPAVATNLNGVYLPAEIAGTAFFDVDRIEVLPGPQGTLYGRNSTGGVINLISRTPGDRVSANGFLELGNYDRVQVVAAVDLPITGTLASRTAGTVLRRDGYFNNGEDDQRTFAIRETLLWRPGPGTTITGVATYNHEGGIGNVLQNIPFQECGPRCATFNPRALGYRNNVDVFEGSLQVEQELARDVSLTYIGGYSYLDMLVRNTIFTGPPIAPLAIDETIESQSHELRLNGRLGALEAVLGAYYFDQDSFYQQDARPTPAARLFNPFDGGSRGEAVFGQATYSLTDALRFTGGLRYSHTVKTIDGFNSTLNPAGVRVLFRPYAGRSSLNRVDWKAAVEVDVTPDTLLYGNVATGFTPGGFSTGPAIVGQLAAAPFKPVYLRAYTGGVKNRLLDGALTLNVEGFYYDYKNYQVSARDILTAQNLVFNAEKATVYGVEVQSRVRIGRNGDLSLGATYLHAEADRLRTPTASFDGFDLPYSPKWTVNAFYQHRFEVGGGAELRGSANFKYTSGRWAIYTHAPGFYIDANTRTDLNFGYFAPEERWSLQAFVRNVEDNLVKTNCGNALPGLAGCGFEAPRTYGATLGFKY